jgi:hypothetical protein
MATTTMTMKCMNITVPANTNEHEINFDGVMPFDDKYGIAAITMKTGTAVQFNNNGVTITADSMTLSSSGNNTKELIEIEKGIPLKYKGGAGSETFNINIIARA